MSTTLRDVAWAVEHGLAALVAESAGYLVLLAADAASVSSTHADADSVSLDAEGNVALIGRAVTAPEAEASLRALLAGLLGLVRSPAPNLSRVAQRPDCRGLATLVVELEAALVPVNRRAARRSLARLFREATRAQAQRPAQLQPPAPPPLPSAAPPLPLAVRTVRPPAPHPPARSHAAQLELTLTPPPSPRQTSVVSTLVADAMLGVLGQAESPLPSGVMAASVPTPSEAIWVEEEDVLTEMWNGTRVVIEAERTVIDAPVAPRSSPAPYSPIPMAVRSPSPLPVEALTPLRISSFPLTPLPEPETFDEVPLFAGPAAPERRPSDVSDLLSKMKAQPSSDGEVRRGLLGLSQLEELEPRRAVGES